MTSKPNSVRFSQVNLSPFLRCERAGRTGGDGEGSKELPCRYIGMGVTSWK